MAGSNAYVMVLTAAYTGMRWGETTGLRWTAIDTDRRVVAVQPDGSLHEIGGRCFLGPPKTAESAREIPIPPFLADLLQAERQHAGCGLKTAHPDGTERVVDGVVFTSPDGGWWRRSTFSRRYWRPAVNGEARRGWGPVKPGLTFHGLRHSHNTWMIDEGCDDVVRARRLGHHVPDKIQDVYGHVADRVNRRLVKALEKRWRKTWSRAHPGDPVPWSTTAAPNTTKKNDKKKNDKKEKERAKGAVGQRGGVPRRTDDPRAESSSGRERRQGRSKAA
ncbi:site-specific integrase [Yinghuangia seranimata]|uniref:site-specific integrase n=1 Tax=Yinghuangia seranimata TaxID=408067 RepID=UPI00248B45E2|nr:site-specific integrase [Yinghuangia seranimata]MDI2130541.1 site-specific integrase [Yinghuangia seranimata]